MIKFKAKIIREIAHNGVDWGSYTFDTNDNIEGKNNNPKSLIEAMASISTNIVGNMPILTIGAEYNVEAELTNHPKFGLQYKVKNISLCKPEDKEALLSYLKTICTKLQAEKIVKKYPDFINHLLQNNTLIVKGISKKSFDKIKEKVLESYIMNDILALLGPLGITYKTIMKLSDTHTTALELKQILYENPYVLTRVHGLGFAKVDNIALQINPELKVSKYRLNAYIKYILSEQANTNGHTIVDIDFIRIEVKTRMSENIHFFDDVIAEQEFKRIGSNIGLKINYDNEMYVYNTLLEKTKIKCNEVYVSNSIDIILTEEQLEAVSVACNNPFTIIIGPAGTGKTTVIKTILHYLENDALNTISLIQDVALCSLSAKASKRMEEVTEHKATTIHRLLGYNGKTFKFNKDNTLPYTTVIVDEASMDNTWIFRKLLEAIEPDTKLIIVFDHAQLEPIGEGNIATDLLNSNEFPVCRLTKIHRQAEKSGIITFATAVRNNKNIIEQFFSDKFIKIGENQDMIIKFKNNIIDSVVSNYLEAMTKYGIDNVVVITPRKSNAELCCLSINTKIQQHLTSKEKSIIYFSKHFNIKDKVIQKINNYQKDIINGEIGFVVDIDEHEMTVDFDGKIISYRKNELKELELAYALTVHSFQGSQADVVIVSIDNGSFIMLDNKLLYTAITRASKYCLLYISESAYRKCIFNSANNNRNTFINEIKRLEVHANSESA